MKKKAKDLKVGDRIVVAGQEFIVRQNEVSDIGKQGIQKCRLVISNEKNEKVVIIRPADYPFEAK